MKRVELDMNVLLKLHDNGNGLSYQQLANRFGTSKATIKRRFKSSQVKPEKDTAVLSFAARLQELLPDVPNGSCKKELMRCIQTMRTRHAISRNEKKQLIVNSLKTGARELEEICEDTGFEKSDSVALLEEMATENLIVIRERGGVLNRGRKIKYHYFLIPS